MTAERRRAEREEHDDAEDDRHADHHEWVRRTA
jgi:hypothetical protein